MITVIHYKGGYKHAINSVGRVVLGSGYFTGRQPPNFPVPAPQLRIEYDYSEVRRNKIIGLCIWENYRGKALLVQYHPKQ